MKRPRVLVAGIGNIFLGDDGFGVEVAQRLASRTLPEAVLVVDYGIRGLDLAFSLLDGFDEVILVDAAPRGGAPGTLYVIEPELDRLAESPDPGLMQLEAHSLDPVQVLRLVQAMGTLLPRIRLVGCEPSTFDSEEGGRLGLSAPVQLAVDQAVRLIEEIVAETVSEDHHEVEPCTNWGSPRT